MKAFRDWVRRHRRALLVSAIAVGAGYVLYRSIKAHQARVEDREIHAALLHQAEERMEAQLQSHFQSIQQISDATTLPSVLPGLKKQLLSKIDLSGLTEKLVKGKEVSQGLTQQEKNELWQELKILSFTRATCSMWALTMLNLFVRIQLNILGRHVYIDTARDISTSKLGEQRRTLSKACQQKYIAFADFLPHSGLDMLICDTKAAVKNALLSKPLKEPCTLRDLREIFDNIHRNFEENHANWLAYMLPEENALPDDLLAASSITDAAQYMAGDIALHHDDENLELLLIETRVILASDEFRDILTLSYGLVLDGVMEEFTALYEGRPIPSVPLAKLLPPVASMGTSLLEQPNENRFVQMIATQKELQSFCATVYSVGES